MKATGNDAESSVREVIARYHDAMVTADTRVLDGLLDREFELVHMSGYVQPKDEWLGVVASGELDYHSIQIDESALSVMVSGDAAEVTGRGVFDATIYGTRRPWRMRFTVWLTEGNATWVITRARYVSNERGRQS